VIFFRYRIRYQEDISVINTGETIIKVPYPYELMAAVNAAEIFKISDCFQPNIEIGDIQIIIRVLRAYVQN